MGNYIRSADLNVQNGLLEGRMLFQDGLNILSGENGTLKTKTLHGIKSINSSGLNLLDPSTPCRIQAISPKRNAKRRAFQQAVDQFRRENKKLESVINERNMNDSAFEDYPSLGDLYYLIYEDSCKDGGNQKEKMIEVTENFNEVIGKVFSHYKLFAEWDEIKGIPKIELLKHKSSRVPLEGLSLGEQEILSLVTNIYSSKDRYDVFLIDEPEVHLNWHLEERLFDYLDDYCQNHKKQMIVVTHSRVVFKEKYHKKTQFLFWNDAGKISWSHEITEQQRRRIAGEAIETIKLGDFLKPTFFVEDHAHAIVVKAIADKLEVDIIVTECGSASNVRALFRHSKLDSGWRNSYFVEDGDNQGSPFAHESNFIHLEKYCIENYLFNTNVAGLICSRSEDDIKNLIVESIREKKDKIFTKNKFFEFLIDHLKPEHITEENLSKLDASEISSVFFRKIGKTMNEYVSEYIDVCIEKDILESVFPSQIINALKKVKI